MQGAVQEPCQKEGIEVFQCFGAANAATCAGAAMRSHQMLGKPACPERPAPDYDPESKANRAPARRNVRSAPRLSAYPE